MPIYMVSVAKILVYEMGFISHFAFGVMLLIRMTRKTIKMNIFKYLLNCELLRSFGSLDCSARVKTKQNKYSAQIKLG